MKIRGCVLITAAMMLLFSSDCFTRQGKCLVRVLLEQCCENSRPIAIGASQGFILIDRTVNPVKKITCNDSPLKISMKNGFIVVNEKKYAKDKLYITPVSGSLSLGERTYDGIFLIMKVDHELLIINIVDIEKYICGVLRTESWPGWPIEVNKVFAIACRSYVLSMMHDARVNQRPYHVKNTNYHQTYQGTHDNTDLKDAVAHTKGVFLAYNDGPIVAMFDCCCGGVIPAHIHGFNVERAPYLARDYACTHCRPCKIYNWYATYSEQDFLARLKSITGVDKMGKLTNITVSKRDKAGLVQEVVLKGNRSSIAIAGQKLYSLFKEITSFCFSISKKGTMITFKGKGYGHHRGLCQWGAREMVRHGRDYRSILTFYYPGTSFMQLT